MKRYNVQIWRGATAHETHVLDIDNGHADLSNEIPAEYSRLIMIANPADTVALEMFRRPMLAFPPERERAELFVTKVVGVSLQSWSHVMNAAFNAAFKGPQINHETVMLHGDLMDGLAAQMAEPADVLCPSCGPARGTMLRPDEKTCWRCGHSRLA